LQDIGAKYPAWLEANKETAPPEDLARYREQLRHIQDMCALYEHEPDNFDAIYHKMQEVRFVSQAPHSNLLSSAGRQNLPDAQLDCVQTGANAADGLFVC